jgi:hypothetical protein
MKYRYHATISSCAPSQKVISRGWAISQQPNLLIQPRSKYHSPSVYRADILISDGMREKESPERKDVVHSPNTPVKPQHAPISCSRVVQENLRSAFADIANPRLAYLPGWFFLGTWYNVHCVSHRPASLSSPIASHKRLINAAVTSVVHP